MAMAVQRSQQPSIGFVEPQKISTHSGHFPVSTLTGENDHGIGTSYNNSVLISEMGSYQPQPHNKDTIDHTFQKLFACMSLAYKNRALLAAPQFKAFKGLGISVKEKVRLNNIIWREWHLQYAGQRESQKAPICGFTVQMDGVHAKPSIVVLEGKYWKRSTQNIRTEYMKWRVFFKERMKHWKPDDEISVDELLANLAKEDHRAISSFVQNQQIRAHYSPPDMTRDDYKMDLTDDIYSTLQSIGFPHLTQRDFLSLENSDVMQPALIGLEPDLDYDSLIGADTLQDLSLPDAFNMSYEPFKYPTPGQKRPVFTEPLDLQSIADNDTQSSAHPPAYPAFKRSRSSTLQSPHDTEEYLSNLHSQSVTPVTSANRFYQPNVTMQQSVSQPLYMQTTPMQQQTTPMQQQTTQVHSRTVNSYEQAPVHAVQMRQHYNVALQQDLSPTPVSYTTQEPAYAPPPYTSNHSMQYSQPSILTSNSAARQRRPSGNTNLTPYLSPNQNIVDTQLFSNTSPDIGYVVDPVHSEFKKPKGPPRTLQPKSDEKSNFLTQLLRKPLDGENSEKNQERVYQSYFEQFPMNTYSHSSVPSAYPVSSANSSRPLNPDQSGVQDSNNTSSPSEEDKKDTPTAEKKRRQQIKTGFEMLGSIIPTIPTNTTSKTSKAVMLTKTIDFITKLKQDNEEMQSEMDVLTTEVNALNHAISNCQGQLPATGMPAVSQHHDQMQSMLNSYIREQTQKNWKFYVFSKMAAPLFESFYSMVSTTSVDEMYRTSQSWLDQHCALTSLRPALANSMRELCLETSILSDPASFPEQARSAAANLSQTPQTSSYDSTLQYNANLPTSPYPANQRASIHRTTQRPPI